eukprot:TRINITY_DN56066_c0_g1_i1.p1 TRINITY_DN56066_c0_g1~~TRINITY_DN56066_c0_g1_i1.p1  ORF type:complete len:107 (+),score=42.49 TRINITY_DN56066_c0_g1_i1:90-410(+)
MSVAPKLEKYRDVAFPNIEKKQADEVTGVLAKTSDEGAIKGAVEALEPWQHDVLMKFIYKALEDPGRSAATLFKWHDAVVTIAGRGCIVRTLTDRPPMQEEEEEGD